MVSVHRRPCDFVASRWKPRDGVLRTTTVARHWLTVEHSKWTGEAGQVFPPPPIPLSRSLI